MITADTQICMVIGHPIDHTLSPLIHNAGYEALGIADKFVYVASDVTPDDLPDFIHGMRAMHIKGVSCTLPHKQSVMKLVDVLDTAAERAGAVNTIVNEEGELVGYNTDWLGILTPLENIMQLEGKKVAVFGAGGAARAAVFGLTVRGADVTVYNRSLEKAQALAHEFECHVSEAAPGPELKDMDVIFNATPLGMHPHEGQSPVPAELLDARHVVFDAVYNPAETRLLKDAKQVGARTIPGSEMLLYQAVHQFHMYTGQEAPEAIMRKVLLDNLYPKEV